MKREPGLASDPCAVNEHVHDQLKVCMPDISFASENIVPTVFINLLYNLAITWIILFIYNTDELLLLLLLLLYKMKNQ